MENKKINPISLRLFTFKSEVLPNDWSKHETIILYLSLSFVDSCITQLSGAVDMKVSGRGGYLKFVIN